MLHIHKLVFEYLGRGAMMRNDLGRAGKGFLKGLLELKERMTDIRA